MKDEKVSDLLAFPNVTTNGSDYDAGMTLRDYFAAKALQGYLSSLGPDVEPAEFASTIARDAYIIADAMIEARAT